MSTHDDGITVEGNTPDSVAEIAALPETPLTPEAPVTGPPVVSVSETPAGAAGAESASGADMAPLETSAGDRNPDGTFKKGGQTKSIQARIDRAIAAQRAAERRAMALEHQLLTQQQGPPQPGPSLSASADGRPTLRALVDSGTYDTYEEAVEAYSDARDEWRAQQQRDQDRAFAENDERVQYSERLAAFAQQQPDFYQVIEAQARLPVAPVMTAAILQSARGPAIVYYLGTHPEDAFRLAQEHWSLPLDAAPLMRSLLESKVSATAAPSGPAPAGSRQSLPAPIKPVASGPHVTESPPGDDADDEVHRRYYNAKELARTRR